MLAYQDLLQKPNFYQPPALSIHTALAADIVYLVCRSVCPVYRYECLMREPIAIPEIAVGESEENYGFGASFHDPAEAIIKSISEAWERQNSKRHDRTSLIVGSYNDLAGRAVSPLEFSLLSDWERQQSFRAYVPYSNDLALSWMECQQVCDRGLRPALIPAALIYAGFTRTRPQERFVPTLSPGLASQVSLKGAFLGGLCELVERDAFMLVWLHRRRPPRLRSETIDFREAQGARSFLEALEFKLHFVNITSDLGVPVILTVIEHPRLPWAGTLVFGLGCDLDRNAAVRQSFLEALTMLGNWLTIRPAIPPAKAKLKVRQRTLSFGLDQADYFQKARFLIEGSEESSIADLPNLDRHDAGRNMEHLIDLLNHKGHKTYFVDLTPPEYQQSCRLCLTRAFISGLQPMLYEPDLWRLNPERLIRDAARIARRVWGVEPITASFHGGRVAWNVPEGF